MRLKSLFLAATLVASSTSAFAAPFTKLFVLGDSASDNGNLLALTGGLAPAPPYALGRASNGPVAVEYLSLALGLGPLLPAALPGGTNFAVIGAATGNVQLAGAPPGVTADNVAATIGFALPPTGMSNAQLAQFFFRNPGPIDPNALFVVWGGPNDLVLNPSVEVAVAAAANIGMMIDALYGAGARNFLVPNMGDLGLTPVGQGTSASVLSGVFNAALAGQLATRAGRPGISLIGFNTFNLFNSVVASPETYGFTNVEDECYQGPLLGVGGQGTVCATPNSFLFWDQTHPSAAAHALLGARVAAAVPEPAITALTGVGLGVAALLIRRRRAA